MKTHRRVRFLKATRLDGITYNKGHVWDESTHGLFTASLRKEIEVCSGVTVEELTPTVTPDPPAPESMEQATMNPEGVELKRRSPSSK